MIRSWAPSRLHFGLIQPAPVGNADDGRTIPRRQFGGCGVMLQEPCVRLRIEPARNWSAEGPGAARALQFAERWVASLPAGSVTPHHILVEQLPPQHCGFGSGTQLALAVARALATAAGRPDWDSVELARRVGRGLRSAIGVHGNQHGGFIVDGGRGTNSTIAPMIARLPVPAEWRWLLIWPKKASGIHGIEEMAAFEVLPTNPRLQELSAAMCGLLLFCLLPALAEHDFEGFSKGLAEYNRLAGEVFASVQNGAYERGFSANMIAQLRRFGVSGVGQSSWGPGVFGLFPEEVAAAAVAQRLIESAADYRIVRTWNACTSELPKPGQHFE